MSSTAASRIALYREELEMLSNIQRDMRGNILMAWLTGVASPVAKSVSDAIMSGPWMELPALRGLKRTYEISQKLVDLGYSVKEARQAATVLDRLGRAADPTGTTGHYMELVSTLENDKSGQKLSNFMLAIGDLRKGETGDAAQRLISIGLEDDAVDSAIGIVRSVDQATDNHAEVSSEYDRLNSMIESRREALLEKLRLEETGINTGPGQGGAPKEAGFKGLGQVLDRLEAAIGRLEGNVNV